MSRYRLMLMVAAFLLFAAFPAVAQEPLPLTEDFFSVNELVAFRYPTGWLIEAKDTSPFSLNVNIGTTQQVLAKDVVNSREDILTPGEVRVNLATVRRSEIARLVGLPADASITDILSAELALIPDTGAVFGEITLTKTAGYSAAHITFSADGRGEGFLMLVDYGANFVGGIVAFTAPGELSRWEATLLNIIDSVIYADAPEPEATPDLAQTFTSEDGSITISYPDGWQATAHPPTKGVQDVSLASSEAVLNKSIFLGFSKLPTGEAALHAYFGSPAALIGELIDIENSDDPVIFLQSYVDRLNPLMKFDVSEAEPITVNDLPAARIDYQAENRGEGYLLVLRLGDNQLALIDVSAAPDELADWESDIQAIIESLVYTPSETAEPTALELAQHFVSSDNLFAFDYPEDWTIKAFNSDSNSLYVSVATSPGVLTKDPINHDNDKYVPGEASFRFVSAERAFMFETAKLTADANVFDLMTVYMLQLNAYIRDNPVGGETGRFSAAEAVLVGKYPAARAEFLVPDRTNGYVYLIDMKDIILGVTIYYAPGEADLWQPTLEAMLESLTYGG